MLVIIEYFSRRCHFDPCPIAIGSLRSQVWLFNFISLTNRRQFSMVYTLIDHKMTSKNVQNSSGTTRRRRVVSLPSFGHLMASFYGL